MPFAIVDLSAAFTQLKNQLLSAFVYNNHYRFPMFLKPRSKAVIHEFLDNEIILADLDAGIYFSIRESGIPLWQLLTAGYRLEEAFSLFQQKYQADVSKELRPFVDILISEQLLVTTDSREKEVPSPLFWPAPFVSPVFEKYEEMKNLLMLDPIHEVDEQGWPVKKETHASSAV